MTGIETLQILILRCVSVYRKTEKWIIDRGTVNYGEFQTWESLSLIFWGVRRDYQLHNWKGNLFEDAFDEIEILGFLFPAVRLICWRRSSRAMWWRKTFWNSIKNKSACWLILFLASTCPPKKARCIFGTWIDSDGEYSDTAHFPDNLKNYPFQGGGCCSV